MFAWESSYKYFGTPCMFESENPTPIHLIWTECSAFKSAFKKDVQIQQINHADTEEDCRIFCQNNPVSAEGQSHIHCSIFCSNYFQECEGFKFGNPSKIEPKGRCHLANNLQERTYVDEVAQ